VITPATVKKSMGLPANPAFLPAGRQAAGIPAAVRVFAASLRQLNLDEKHHLHLPELSHLENYTLMRNLLPIYHDLAKTQPALNRRQLTLPPGR
jgi:hypothetical protein